LPAGSSEYLDEQSRAFYEKRQALAIRTMEAFDRAQEKKGGGE
jgi:hypothetical protein